MKLWEVIDLIKEYNELEQQIENLNYERSAVSSRRKPEEYDRISGEMSNLEYQRDKLGDTEIGKIDE